MRFLLLVILLGMAAAGLWKLGKAALKAWRERKARRHVETGEWTVDLDKQEQLTVVQLVKPGEDPYLIGSVSVTAPHYEFQERLTELRVEAEAKAYDLNRRLSS
jgi:hypothetical protein